MIWKHMLSVNNTQASVQLVRGNTEGCVKKTCKNGTSFSFLTIYWVVFYYANIKSQQSHIVFLLLFEKNRQANLFIFTSYGQDSRYRATVQCHSENQLAAVCREQIQLMQPQEWCKDRKYILKIHPQNGRCMSFSLDTLFLNGRWL